MDDDHTCNMDGAGMILIKMFDGMVKELKDVRYILQIKKNIISVGVLNFKVQSFLIEMKFSMYQTALWLC